jgi:2-keto-3-deoxy-6-phosphogluconate aldolase
MKENLINVLAEEKILPILRCKDAQLMIDRAKALIDAGVKVIEINVENPTIYKAIEEISKYANVCAGGIITSLQAEAAIMSGAKILSSPIFSMSLMVYI